MRRLVLIGLILFLCGAPVVPAAAQAYQEPSANRHSPLPDYAQFWSEYDRIWSPGQTQRAIARAPRKLRKRQQHRIEPVTVIIHRSWDMATEERRLGITTGGEIIATWNRCGADRSCNMHFARLVTLRIKAMRECNATECAIAIASVDHALISRVVDAGETHYAAH